MAPEERDAAYVWDMLEAAKDVVELMTGKTRQDWRTNKMLRMAVELFGREWCRAAADSLDRMHADHYHAYS